MTIFEIIILALLYIAMIGFVLQNYRDSTGDESLRVGVVIGAILLAWLAPAAFAMYIHQCITKFLDK